jgi:recombination protein RecR
MPALPKTLTDLIAHFERLPGIGPKSAARLAFHVLKYDHGDLLGFSDTLRSIKENITTCTQCFNISDAPVCGICNDATRDQAKLCVVEEPLDIIALEKTQSYTGRYHVLGGVISPLNGVGPDNLKIRELLEKLKNDGVQEVVLATNANVEGEATAMYISKQLEALPVRVTRLAGGLPFGSDLEYTDEMTLSVALKNRQEYSKKTK